MLFDRGVMEMEQGNQQAVSASTASSSQNSMTNGVKARSRYLNANVAF